MRILIGAVGLVLLAGCATFEPSTAAEEVRECMTYRSMMTAPMAPHAMEQLRTACERSRGGVGKP